MLHTENVHALVPAESRSHAPKEDASSILDALPNEILEHVARYLPTSSLHALRLTNRRFAALLCATVSARSVGSWSRFFRDVDIHPAIPAYETEATQRTEKRQQRMIRFYTEIAKNPRLLRCVLSHFSNFLPLSQDQIDQQCRSLSAYTSFTHPEPFHIGLFLSIAFNHPALQDDTCHPLLLQALQSLPDTSLLDLLRYDAVGSHLENFRDTLFIERYPALRSLFQPFSLVNTQYLEIVARFENIELSQCSSTILAILLQKTYTQRCVPVFQTLMAKITEHTLLGSTENFRLYTLYKKQYPILDLLLEDAIHRREWGIVEEFFTQLHSNKGPLYPRLSITLYEALNRAAETPEDQEIVAQLIGKLYQDHTPWDVLCRLLECTQLTELPRAASHAVSAIHPLQNGLHSSACINAYVASLKSTLCTFDENLHETLLHTTLRMHELSTAHCLLTHMDPRDLAKLHLHTDPEKPVNRVALDLAYALRTTQPITEFSEHCVKQRAHALAEQVRSSTEQKPLEPLPVTETPFHYATRARYMARDPKAYCAFAETLRTRVAPAMAQILESDAALQKAYQTASLALQHPLAPLCAPAGSPPRIRAKSP